MNVRRDNSKKYEAQQCLEAFLSKHGVKIQSIREDAVSLEQIIPSSSTLPQLTKFRALDDTYLYARLLETLLSVVPPSQISTLIDLGAGSSIPTVSALIESRGHTGLRVIAVDNDPEALRVSADNVETFGLAERYSFVRKDMLEFLEEHEVAPGFVIASNPPYAPLPSNVTDAFFSPADGGADGTKYIASILSKRMPPSTLVAIRWCSLGHPVKIISLIESNFDIVHLQAHRSPLGTYTGAEPLREHIEQMSDEGVSVLKTGPDGQREMVSIGCILKRR